MSDKDTLHDRRRFHETGIELLLEVWKPLDLTIWDTDTKQPRIDKRQRLYVIARDASAAYFLFYYAQRPDSSWHSEQITSSRILEDIVRRLHDLTSEGNGLGQTLEGLWN